MKTEYDADAAFLYPYTGRTGTLLFMSSCYAAGVKRALLYAALRARFWQGQGFILNLGKIALYDENGKYVRSKKEIPVEDGNVCIGCKIVRKGEVYKRNIFTAGTSFLASPYQ